LQQAALSVVAAASVGCDKLGGTVRFSCTDLSGLTDAQKALRGKFAYTDTSADPKKQCVACVQWVPALPNACGGCKVLPGPVHPEGTCSLFAGKI